MKNIVALLAVATATATAFGGLTEFSTQISTDGGLTWSNNASVSVNTAGASVRVLARSMVRFVPSEGDPAFDKLNSSRHQPSVSGLVAADAHIAGFNATGNINPNFADGLNAGTDLGRDFGGGTVTAVVAHRTSSSTLHFAEGTAPNAPGTGTGSNNVDGSRGINCAQNILSLPSINVLSPIALFYYGFDLVAPSVVNTSRAVSFDVPAAGVGLRGTAPNQFRGVAWGYNNPDTGALTTVNTGLTDSIAGLVEISYVPAPGAAALMGLAGLVAGRRRR